MPDHLELAKETFNRTWEYLDRDDRNEDDDREMLAHAAASWYHWRQVGEPKNRSVSDWQMSRVLSVLGNAAMARSFGDACLKISLEAGLKPFYVGMGHEAIARAASAAGDAATRDEHMAAARTILESIEDSQEAEILAADLETIE